MGNSSTDNTVYLQDLVRDAIVAEARQAAEAAGQKADEDAIRRAVAADMSGSGRGRRGH
ncbi:MAG TPA: hypothetical protein VEZ42_12805 [Pseudonocardia sp.]|nr:hypothetical protein [Pseudonocardia sp.]